MGYVVHKFFYRMLNKYQKHSKSWELPDYTNLYSTSIQLCGNFKQNVLQGLCLGTSGNLLTC